LLHYMRLKYCTV